MSPSGDRTTDPHAALGAFQSTTKGFSILAENAKLFVQGLNGSLASEQIRDVEKFIEYKDVVVRYLREFSLELERRSPQIATLVRRAEELGLDVWLPRLAELEAAPVLGRSRSDTVEREARRMREQWAGLKQWFLPDLDRPSISQLLLNRASEAINFIILTVSHINDQRFRRANRTADLVALAGWFDHAAPGPETTALWRTAFGSYPARHLGNPREVGEDDWTEESWWLSAPAPVAAEHRSRGPRAESSPVPRVRNPRRVKSMLAAQQQQEEATTQSAEQSLAGRGPIRLSELPALETSEAEVFLSCLGLVLSARRDRKGLRRARTPDGRLRIVLAPAPDPHAGAAVRLRGGRLSLADFELTVSLIGGRA